LKRFIHAPNHHILPSFHQTDCLGIQLYANPADLTTPEKENNAIQIFEEESFTSTI
jgi:hypothetical protein